MPGTPVFLDFGPRTFTVRPAEISTASPTATALTLMGRRPARLTRPRLTRELAESLWLPPDSTIDDILELLDRRRDTDLAERVAAALR